MSLFLDCCKALRFDCFGGQTSGKTYVFLCQEGGGGGAMILSCLAALPKGVASRELTIPLVEASDCAEGGGGMETGLATAQRGNQGVYS